MLICVGILKTLSYQGFVAGHLKKVFLAQNGMEKIARASQVFEKILPQKHL